MGNKEFTCASILTFIFSLIVSIYFLGSPGILFTYMWFFTGFGAFLILRFFVKVFLILLSIAALFVGVFFLSQYWVKINEILSMIVPLDLGLGPLLLFWIIILIILVTFRIIIDPTTKWISLLSILCSHCLRNIHFVYPNSCSNSNPSINCVPFIFGSAHNFFHLSRNTDWRFNILLYT